MGLGESLRVDIASYAWLENHDAIRLAIFGPVLVIASAEVAATVGDDDHLASVVGRSVHARLAHVRNIHKPLFVNTNAIIIHVVRLVELDHVLLLVLPCPCEARVHPAKTLSRPVESSRIGVVEVWRGVRWKGVREWLIVDEFHLLVGVCQQLAVESLHVGHRAFEVATVMGRAEEVNTVVEQVGDIVDAILDLDRVLSASPARVVWKHTDIDVLWVILAVVVDEGFAIRAAITVGHAGGVSRIHHLVPGELGDSAMVRLPRKHA
mmetsp:Transcript_13806/g.26323  ORF Transcript_13806/g.26323 Transcript_13806/m.26323 type:complete len:265 (-) Transcript_13806:200-994(-)